MVKTTSTKIILKKYLQLNLVSLILLTSTTQQGLIMTINGVEQGCIRSQAVVYLLDVYQDGLCLDEPFTTAAQYEELLSAEMDRIRSEVNAK